MPIPILRAKNSSNSKIKIVLHEVHSMVEDTDKEIRNPTNNVKCAVMREIKNAIEAPSTYTGRCVLSTQRRYRKDARRSDREVET